MVQTNTEYMSDAARVERVVRKFMNMTVKELKKVQSKKFIDFITNEIIPKEGLSEEKVQHMSFMEFACLIDHVGGKPQYVWHNHDSLSERLFYYRCIAGALLEGSKASIPIKLFTALPLMAFYMYLDRVSVGEKDFREEYVYVKRHCSYREGYTIKDFLVEKITVINKAWVPIDSLAEYEDKMRTAYADLGRLLIDSFLMAFPDKFHPKDICQKYHHIADEREDDSSADEFRYEESKGINDDWQRKRGK